MNKAQVIGVGMIPFAKLGKHQPYAVMSGVAIRNAIADAGIDFTDVHAQ